MEFGRSQNLMKKIGFGLVVKAVKKKEVDAASKSKTQKEWTLHLLIKQEDCYT